MFDSNIKMGDENTKRMHCDTFQSAGTHKNATEIDKNKQDGDLKVN